MDIFLEYLKTAIRPRDSSEYIECNYNLESFASLKQDGIMVSDITPTHPCPNCECIQIGNRYILKKTFKNLEWLRDDNSNTFEFTESSVPIYRRLLPPPDETINHTLIIKSIIEESNPSEKCYIEYGVRMADTLKVISPLVKTSFGVDIQSPPELPTNCEFHKMFTNEFSTTLLPEINYHFAFIDADHKFESVYQDFQYLYQYIQPGGYLFLHDTYPCAERFLDPNACNDCYKTPIAIKQMYPDIELLTLPLNPGLTIVRKNM